MKAFCSQKRTRQRGFPGGEEEVRIARRLVARRVLAREVRRAVLFVVHSEEEEGLLERERESVRWMLVVEESGFLREERADREELYCGEAMGRRII